MQMIPSLLFGVAASLDALLVGITYGIRQIHIPFRQNLFISLITLLGTCLSIVLGKSLTPLFPDPLGQFAGSSILILFGIYYLIKFMMVSYKRYLLSKHSKDSHICEKTEDSASLMLTLSESCTLALALSLNNMGIGFSASMAGLSPISAAIVTLFCSCFFLWMGNRLGCCPLLQLSKQAADLISGLLLIILGICEIVF